MNHSRVGFAGAIILVAAFGCAKAPPASGVYQGYLEGRYLGVASPQEGQLRELPAHRGEWVEAGATLFALDPQPEADQLREDEQRVASAQAAVDDLRKGLRDTELATLDAQVKADRAALEQANAEWQRSEALRADKFVSENELDRLRLLTLRLNAEAERDANQLATGKLGAREDQIRQAAADLAAAEAVRDRTRWLLGQKTQTAPQAGYVQDTLFRVGERVEPGKPVVVLLPSSELRARFFVPEAEIARLKLGENVTIALNGREPVKARVSYISTQVEFTPPIIYSREQNHKYVFMVEADIDPAVARDLRVGQPAEVTASP